MKNYAMEAKARLKLRPVLLVEYRKTGKECINRCFDEDGKWKYCDLNDHLVMIEVPSDKYDEALEVMERKISDNCIPGIREGTTAESIVKKGLITYRQAENIATCGAIDSLSYTFCDGISFSDCEMGMSATVAYAMSLWSGLDEKSSMQNAIPILVKIFGVDWASEIIAVNVTSDVSRGKFTPKTDDLLKKVGYSAASRMTKSASKKLITSSAVASKAISTGVATGALTTAVMSTADMSRALNGKISSTQLIKNVSVKASGVTGGTIGWTTGAYVGAAIGSVIPIAGTAAGGVIGGFVGSIYAKKVASKYTKKVLDGVIDDDSKIMLDILEKQFEIIVGDYLLIKSETILLNDRIASLDVDKILKKMYTIDETRRHIYAYELLEKMAAELIRNRKFIKLPDEKSLTEGLSEYSLKIVNAKETSAIIDIIRRNDVSNFENISDEIFASHTGDDLKMAIFESLRVKSNVFILKFNSLGFKINNVKTINYIRKKIRCSDTELLENKYACVDNMLDIMDCYKSEKSIFRIAKENCNWKFMRFTYENHMDEDYSDLTNKYITACIHKSAEFDEDMMRFFIKFNRINSNNIIKTLYYGDLAMIDFFLKEGVDIKSAITSRELSLMVNISEEVLRKLIKILNIETIYDGDMTLLDLYADKNMWNMVKILLVGSSDYKRDNLLLEYLEYSEKNNLKCDTDLVKSIVKTDNTIDKTAAKAIASRNNELRKILRKEGVIGFSIKSLFRS